MGRIFEVARIAQRFSAMPLDSCQPVTTRWAGQRDWPIIALLESQCFDCCYTRCEIDQLMAESHTVAVVAEAIDKVVGYAIWSLQERYATLLRIGVAPHARRKLIGYELMRDCLRAFLQRERSKALAIIAERNLPSQLFFRRCGWWATELVPQYWDAAEDAIIFEYRNFWKVD